MFRLGTLGDDVAMLTVFGENNLHNFNIQNFMANMNAVKRRRACRATVTTVAAQMLTSLRRDYLDGGCFLHSLRAQLGLLIPHEPKFLHYVLSGLDGCISYFCTSCYVSRSNLRVKVAVAEERHRKARPTATINHDPVLSRFVQVIGPACSHISEVDNKRPCKSQHN